jgi:lipoprotein-releasing system ATP-binding protein
VHLTSKTQSLRVEELKKVFRSGSSDLVLFENLSFNVSEGEMLAIVGESGTGKSTLLHILGGLDRPTAGDVFLGSVHVNRLGEEGAADLRATTIGFVWQFHYLLPEFTALENTAMPLLIQGAQRRPALKTAADWLDQVGLSDRGHHRTGELSGGEQQRVALARALIAGPKVLMADEPTGDLDAKTADVVFGLIRRLHQQHGLTSLIVTHNMDFARQCDRALRLTRGHVEEVASATLT